jgi:hypothetical protein
MRNRVQFLSKAVYPLPVLFVKDKRRGLRNTTAIKKVFVGEPEVEGNRPTARLQDGKVGLEPSDRISAEEKDLVMFMDVLLQKTVGNPVGPVAELLPGDLLPETRQRANFYKCRGSGTYARELGNDIDQVHGTSLVESSSY